MTLANVVKDIANSLINQRWTLGIGIIRTLYDEEAKADIDMKLSGFPPLLKVPLKVKNQTAYYASDYYQVGDVVLVAFTKHPAKVQLNNGDQLNQLFDKIDFMQYTNAVIIGGLPIDDGTNVIPDGGDVQVKLHQAIGVAISPGTTSTTFVPVPDMILSVPTTGYNTSLIIFFNGVMHGTNNATVGELRLVADGTPILGSQRTYDLGQSRNHAASDREFTLVNPGPHTIQACYRKFPGTPGTVIFYDIQRIMTIIEFVQYG